jgi:predicted nuclease with TOPRIM domain
MPDLAPFFAFLAATAVGLAMSVAAFLFARKSGLATIQANLVSTLKENADALSDRVDILEAKVVELNTQKTILESTVKRLRDAVTDLAAENAELRRKLRLPVTKVDVP